MFKSSSSKI